MSPRRKWSVSSGARSRFLVAAVFLGVVGTAVAAIFDMTLEDFHLSGTQVLDVGEDVIWTSDNCLGCHGPWESPTAKKNSPYGTWEGSLMAQAGRDPLFFAQMTNANQDVANVGNFCMRCHVPMSFVTGNANQADGSTLNDVDRDGVNCHLCHSMVDPIYKPGISPPEDEAILAGMDEVPEYYGNAMFVLDPTGTRRGPRDDADSFHEVLPSPFHKTGEFCGTCHDVGNVAVTRQKDGTYRYNALDERSPTEDLWEQFPLERTYTEWKLSEFATEGVDMGGRFGGLSDPVVSTCQDCHMPKAYDRACLYEPPREDLARHTFAGSSAWVLDIIGVYYKDDDTVNKDALKRGRAAAISMIRRAATLELEQIDEQLMVRVINETGHKLPTGHIEGRRVFVNVKFFDAGGELLQEYGHYDLETAHLDVDSTSVYEMHVGLSKEASKLTGLPSGVTTHMALADTIEKDSRIPPRGFNNAAYEAAGAPAVGTEFADGQYWHDTLFNIPTGAVTAEAGVYYQIVTRHYIEALRDGNQTDDWGDILYDLWLQTNKAAPEEITTETITLNAFGGLREPGGGGGFKLNPGGFGR